MAEAAVPFQPEIIARSSTTTVTFHIDVARQLDSQHEFESRPDLHVVRWSSGKTGVLRPQAGRLWWIADTPKKHD